MIIDKQINKQNMKENKKKIDLVKQEQNGEKLKRDKICYLLLQLVLMLRKRLTS